jgi:hypothetical protein
MTTKTKTLQEDILEGLFGEFISHIQKKHGENMVFGLYVAIITELKKKFIDQQVKLDKIKKKFIKIENKINSQMKSKNGFVYFNAFYSGDTNKKKLPHGIGTLLFQPRDKNYPEDQDIYLGEFFNGTKTGIGKYIYFNDRNIVMHPTTIPYYIGEWSGDDNYGLGSKIIDSFESLSVYEGEFKNNKIFGFGKWVNKKAEGDTELIGYFNNGTAIGFGLRIQKDKKGKIISDLSGLYEYDNSDPNNKKGIIHFKFPNNSFFDKIDLKKKSFPIIKTIFQTIIDKGYFNKEICSIKFKKLKLEAQLKHMELLSNINSYWPERKQNQKFRKFVDKQAALKANLVKCEKINEIKELESLINKSLKTFKTFT